MTGPWPGTSIATDPALVPGRSSPAQGRKPLVARGPHTHPAGMFAITAAEAAAIRAAFEQRGELSAAVELRRLFPGVTDTAQARACAGPSPAGSRCPCRCARGSGGIRAGSVAPRSCQLVRILLIKSRDTPVQESARAMIDGGIVSPSALVQWAPDWLQVLHDRRRRDERPIQPRHCDLERAASCAGAGARSESWSTRPNWTGTTSPRRSRAWVAAICTPSRRG